MDIIQSFTLSLHKHESLQGMVFRCNQERTLYVPVPSLDQMVCKHV
jgi:hypothetical protein